MERIGRYQIVKELGRGAMGVVYLATDPNIGRPVAIKTIRLGDVQKPEERERLRERLFREARSAGMLSHPGIVTIYDVEQQGDLAYIAMEFVDGPTLDYVLSETAGIGPEPMFSVLTQTAAALDYAHQKGIVHRDIKPANIMIAADGATKVTDFGIAKVTTSEHLTMTGTIVGTPHYMSPEQVQGLSVDGRSDQFSLAVIAYEMLTGEKPYTGEHLTTVVYKIVAEEPVAPRRLNPTVSGAIEEVLRKALAKTPDARYPTCQEFAGALEKACDANPGWRTMPRGGSLSEPTVADVRPAVNLPPARRARAAEPATIEQERARKSSLWSLLFAVTVAIVLLVLLGWQAGPWLNKPAPRTAPSKPVAQEKAPAPPIPASAPPEEKPTPLAEPAPPPPEDNAAAAPDVEPQSTPPEKLPARPAVKSALMVVSSPGGATVVLDGRTETACKAPCSLEAAPGRHSLVFSMDGYQVERREVDVGSSAIELPPVILRALGGTIMLSSDPPGASIAVNGRKLPQLTPAQVALSPGNYNITVEKDGKQATRPVDVQNGVINYLKVVLN